MYFLLFTYLSEKNTIKIKTKRYSYKFLPPLFSFCNVLTNKWRHVESTKQLTNTDRINGLRRGSPLLIPARRCRKVTLEVNASCETAKRIKVETFLSRDNASRDILDLKDGRWTTTFLNAFYATSGGSIKVSPIDFTPPLATTARLHLDKNLSSKVEGFLHIGFRLPDYTVSAVSRIIFRDLNWLSRWKRKTSIDNVFPIKFHRHLAPRYIISFIGFWDTEEKKSDQN